MAIAGAIAAPAAAQNVEDGVDAWTRGDYAGAVAQWQAPAAAGDPDAMFNLAQAYRLGRGVPTDLDRAETLYEQAAQTGHIQAADVYGLMLFQDGRRQAALPFVQSASRRGDPRARYLIGVAHFNGDLVPRDWERAYALITLANASGLPQARAALADMDEHIPLEQRQNGVALARILEDEAVRARSAELAAFDLGTAGSVQTAGAPSAPAQSVPSNPAASNPAASNPAPSNPALANATPQIPRPIPSVAVSPSVAAARDAVNQARQASGTEDPGQAGASFANAARPFTPAPRRPAARPAPESSSASSSASAAASASAPANRAAAATPARDLTAGPWRVQLGAFGIEGNAERLWARLSARPEIRGRQRLLVPSGRVTRLLAGGYATQSEAQNACSSLKRAGHDCLVTRN